MPIIGCYSIKGGVGKTATAVNLAYLAAAAGRRVLLWDLDPQGAASFYVRVAPRVKGGVRKALKNAGSLEARVRTTPYDRLDLMPADFSYRNMDLALDDSKTGKNRTGRIRKLLRPLAADYDVIMLDCPPSVSLVSENVLHAADALVVPTIPTTLSLRTYEQLDRFRRDEDLDDLLLLPFLSMVDRRRKLHRDVADAATGPAAGPAAEGPFLPVSVPYASDVERMGLEQAPLPAFAPNGRAARAYRALWAAVDDRVRTGGVQPAGSDPVQADPAQADPRW